MLRVARVVGLSMAPTLRDGDFVLALRQRSASRLVPGDIVLVNHPSLGVLVKRLQRIDAAGQLELAGDGLSSSSSEAMGKVPSAAVLGRAWLRIAPAPRGMALLGRVARA